MKNKIVCVTRNEANLIKENVQQNKDIFFAEISGSKITTEEEYVYEMSHIFAFPQQLPKMSLGWYKDYICDLMWIKQKDIVMLIRDYDMMLADNQNMKENIIADFDEIILPWWEGEVVGHMVGGKPRGFMIYLETMPPSDCL